MEEAVHAPDDMRPDAVCDGGNLDCGSGLLLLIRKAVNACRQAGCWRFAARRSACVKTSLPGVA